MTWLVAAIIVIALVFLYLGSRFSSAVGQDLGTIHDANEDILRKLLEMEETLRHVNSEIATIRADTSRSVRDLREMDRERNFGPPD